MHMYRQIIQRAHCVIYYGLHIIVYKGLLRPVAGKLCLYLYIIVYDESRHQTILCAIYRTLDADL